MAEATQFKDLIAKVEMMLTMMDQQDDRVDERFTMLAQSIASIFKYLEYQPVSSSQPSSSGLPL